MTKPDGRKAKNRNKDGEKKAVEPRYQKPKKVKVSGPRPASYEPNPERQRNRGLQCFADKIAEARNQFPLFVKGEIGTYLIGTNQGGRSKGFEMEVKMIDKDGSGQMLAIEGPMEAYGARVYIPHVWLFIPFAKCHFVKGYIGKVQCDMLGFLQSVLHSEIREEKQRYFEEQQARESAQPAEATVVENEPAPSGDVATVPVQTSMWQQECRPIGDLVKNECYGFYNLSDEEGLLILELRAGKRQNEFLVKKVSKKHHLARNLIEGAIFSVNSLHREAPDLDKHIRGMLAMSGIRIRGAKPQRDKRSHVELGLPNVHEATMLAA